MKHSIAFSIPNDLIMIVPASVRLCEFAARNSMHPRDCHRFNVAIDEILCNIICYAYPDEQPHYIAIQMEILPEQVHLAIRDDGIPFDLTAYPEPDTSSPLEERQTGGLGIHLVRRLMHRVTYERKFGQNIVHLVQFREPQDSMRSE